MSWSWVPKEQQSLKQMVKAPRWEMLVQSHAGNPCQRDQASPLALHIPISQPGNGQTGTAQQTASLPAQLCFTPRQLRQQIASDYANNFFLKKEAP